jgi:hypothetical protein
MSQQSVSIPWYATLFRGDKFEIALMEIAPVALRYGATRYEVTRARDDQYKFLQTADFDSKLDFERYWQGEEFVAWRADYSGWYQVPVIYGFNDVVARGALGGAEHTGSTEGQPAVG